MLVMLLVVIQKEVTIFYIILFSMIEFGILNILIPKNIPLISLCFFYISSSNLTVPSQFSLFCSILYVLERHLIFSKSMQFL